VVLADDDESDGWVKIESCTCVCVGSRAMDH
jgi:hypothetical protein